MAEAGNHGDAHWLSRVNLRLRSGPQSPCRYLILLHRMTALLAVDFTAHATRQDIVAPSGPSLGVTGSVGGGEAMRNSRGAIRLPFLIPRALAKMQTHLDQDDAAPTSR